MSRALLYGRSIFLAVERRITQTAVALGCLGLVLAALVGFYQVIARFILFRPASWSEPMIQIALIWMTYLALAGAMRTGTLISVDMLLRLSKGPFKRILTGTARIIRTVMVTIMTASIANS